MEMETSRRSALDRSREPITKKPRLADEGERDRAPSAGVTADRIRPYAQARPAGSGGGSGGNPRFKPSDREREDREDSGKAGSYQQQQELLSQYRTALAELTFNSKPIITNLTIIAGENLHSAKSITNIVCANVLEVPSVQKLPSLYLLDSIVKNIGRDYIKYFAARLPEVFCKAYQQVDSSVHPSLRHLFGTWKGVFPASCLQSIEKELGFQPIINGSSEGTGTKSDVQTQRTPHSIHVNLKYLEARQRLQQSNRGKEISSEEIDEIVSPVDNAERSIRTTSAGSMRQLSELPKKVFNVQLPRREQQSSDFTNEKKSYKDARDLNFSSQLLRKPDLGVGRIIDRVNELDEMGRAIDQVKESDEPSKAYFRAGGAAESTAYRRNGFDADHVYDSYRALGSVRNNSLVPSFHSNRANWPASKSWKASEEEEYIWDDMGSRSVEYEGAGNKRNSWSTDDQDKPPNIKSHKWLSVETEQVDSRFNKFDSFQMRPNISGAEDRIHFPRKEHEEHFLQPNSEETEPRGSRSSWPLPLCDTSVPALALDRAISRVSGQTERRVDPLGGVLSTNDNSSIPRSGFQSTLTSSLGPSMDALGSSGMLGQQRQLPLRSPSPTFPSAQSAPLQQQKQHSPIDQDYLPVLSSQMGQNSSQLSGPFRREKFALFSTDSFPISSESPRQKAHTSLNSQPSQPHTSQPSLSPFLEQKQHLSSLQQSLPDQSQAVQNETSAYVSHGFRANESKGFSGSVHSSTPLDVSGQSNTSNLLAAIFKSDFLSNKPASGFNIHPPLPSGPPPVQTLPSSSALPTSSTEMTSLGIITPGLAPPLPVGMLPPLPPGPPPSASLLSSSLQTTNSTSIGLNPLSSLLSSLVAKGIITSTSTQLPAVSSSQMSKESTSQNSDLDGSTSTPPPSSKEFAVRSSSTARRISLTENLIGTQFKTEIVREFHPGVIDSLLDDLNHQCNACGLRFRHQGQLQSHLDWHSSNSLEINDSDKVCRRWYSSISSWVSGDIEPQCGPASFISLEDTSEEHLEPMVTADESQSICVFCGEPFEDFYSVERDEWMYRGTIYLNLMNDKHVARGGMEERMVDDPIVHAKCISASEVYGGVAQRS
ncbi:hypothetical protein KSP39_PZI007231 [Platanthera zijinensis]|uniref:PCF11 n=1 Tax=Platanthera zijinensis TaxID=2320716 RepID=A0AAP0GA01_9ASPA